MPSEWYAKILKECCSSTSCLQGAPDLLVPGYWFLLNLQCPFCYFSLRRLSFVLSDIPARHFESLLISKHLLRAYHDKRRSYTASNILIRRLRKRASKLNWEKGGGKWENVLRDAQNCRFRRMSMMTVKRLQRTLVKLKPTCLDNLRMVARNTTLTQSACGRTIVRSVGVVIQTCIQLRNARLSDERICIRT